MPKMDFFPIPLENIQRSKLLTQPPRQNISSSLQARGGGGGCLEGRGGAAKIWPRPVQLPVPLTSAGAKMQLSPRSRATLSPSLDGRSAKTTL